MAKILVTGGAGYIGSHVSQALIQCGHEVYVYDNLSTGFSSAVSTDSHFFQGDILDTATLSKVLIENKIDAVVHFAAKLIVSESVEKPFMYYQNNVSGVLSLLQACGVAGVRKVLFSSTAAVYGNAGGEVPIKESDPCMPLNPYGWSKLMGERVLIDAANSMNIDYIIFRYFNVAGASLSGDNGQRSLNSTHLIKVACEAITGKRSTLSVFGSDYPTPDGTGIRDYIHVEDLVSAHVMGVNHLLKNFIQDIFNCGYGVGYSVREVIAAMEKVGGKKINVQLAPRREGDPACVVADSAKLQNMLKWEPRFNDIEQICASALSWEQKL